MLKGPTASSASPVSPTAPTATRTTSWPTRSTPRCMERHFALQADLAALHNRAAARAYAEARLPPLYRLDHDMADSRGTLVDIESLDRIWFPALRALPSSRCCEAGVRLIWHCDGNLMEMVPRLLEVGLGGFQGFQYEDGMDYEKICRMKSGTARPDHHRRRLGHPHPAARHARRRAAASCTGWSRTARAPGSSSAPPAPSPPACRWRTSRRSSRASGTTAGTGGTHDRNRGRTTLVWFRRSVDRGRVPCSFTWFCRSLRGPTSAPRGFPTGTGCARSVIPTVTRGSG